MASFLADFVILQSKAKKELKEFIYNILKETLKSETFDKKLSKEIIDVKNQN